MFDDDDDNEILPIPRRSLINRLTDHFNSDNENCESYLFLNNSISTDSGVDENIQTPIQLIALYEKTVELATKNKINAKNAFHFPFVERLPEIIDIIAFDDKLDSSNHHHQQPNFVKAGSVIDTSAKIYGFRVDALHTETQKLNGSIQQKEEEQSEPIDSDSTESIKQVTQRSKPKSSSYLVTDLSSISLSYEFNFHPYQSPNLCQWPGGIGIDSLYADMISYTMYSTSDFPLFTTFMDSYNQNEQILDITMNTMYDLIPLRNVIKDNEGHDHILGCQMLRDFSFNENLTESVIETIDECSIIDDSLMDINNDYELSELRDEPSNFYFQEIQSAHTFPTTMASMDSKISFVDQIPQLLREKTDLSEYSYFDSTKLKLFAGPYLWKYTNLLPPIHKTNFLAKKKESSSTRYFKFDLFSKEKSKTLKELMSWKKKYKRKILSTNLRKDKSSYQLKYSRKIRPLNDLSSLNYFPDYNPEISLENFQFDIPDHDIQLPEQFEYDFDRPIYYDKIEFDKNFAKIDAKKLQIELYDEYNHEQINTNNPISLSTLCFNLIDRGMISYDKDQIVSAFYCMLNNCNKNHLYMKNNLQRDDLIIQKQPFNDYGQRTYS